MEHGDQNHWEHVYTSKPEEMLSWHEDVPALSLELIRQYAKPGSVIDIGGGSSTLAGMLVEAGFSPCAVLDISTAALERAKSRLEPSISAKIDWRVADLLSEPDLPPFDIWHDRAVFHFLVDPLQRAAYRALAARTVPSGGLLILSTFGLHGPEKCSGLPVQRYDPGSLAKQFEHSFSLKKDVVAQHSTPWGAAQPFLYVVMNRL
jgi:SAM-dependent methyltransferase